MIKILFICHGNICRSPMAEYVFKDITQKYSESFYVESKATSREEIGNDIYPPAKKKLKEKGIAFSTHSSRQVTVEDYEFYDYLIVMEDYNIPRLMNIIKSDPEKKVYKLLDFTAHGGDVEDPWFTGNFEKVFNDIKEGCLGLLKHFLEHGML